MSRNHSLTAAVAVSFCLAVYALPAHSALEVLVTPERTASQADKAPLHTSVVTRQQLENSHARTVAEALRGIGSTVVTDLFGDGSRTSVGLRGFGETASHNTLVLVDGRELNNSDSSSPEWSTMSIENIERIEIIEGSAGSLYGDKAVGGVINIITRQPEAFDARLQVGGGSYNRQMAQADIQDRLDNGLTYRLFVEDRRSDNYRDNNDLEYSHYYGRVGYRAGALKTYLEAGSTREDQEAPGALTVSDVTEDRRQSLPPYANDFSDTETDFTRAVFEYQVTQGWRFEGDVSREKADSVFRLSSSFGAATSDSSYQREQKAFNPRFVGEWDTARGQGRLTVGGDFSQVDYGIESPFGTTETEREAEAVYVRGRLPVARRWSLITGARHAEVEDEVDDSVSIEEFEYDSDVAELGVHFEASESARIYLRADQNFRVATTDEAAFTATGVAQLSPQQGTSYEFGGDFDFDGITYGINFYQLDLEDEIAYDPTAAGPFGPGANVNLDETRRRGVILKSTVPLNQSTAVSVHYHRIDAEFRSGGLAGNTVSAVPGESARLSLDYQPVRRLTLYSEAVYTGQQYVEGDNTNSLPKRGSYTLYNLAARYALADWVMGLRLNNVGDKTYAANINSFGGIQPAPGINGWLTLAYHF